MGGLDVIVSVVGDDAIASSLRCPAFPNSNGKSDGAILNTITTNTDKENRIHPKHRVFVEPVLNPHPPSPLAIAMFHMRSLAFVT